MESFFHNPFGLLTGWDQYEQNLVATWLMLMTAVVIITFIVSEITKNYSQVDKLWSLLPIAYSWITVASVPNARLIIMAIIVTIWGFRLSYNFYRKGGYSIYPWRGEEDYRWKVMKETTFLKSPIRFSIFNLLFISFYQNIVILLFCTPLLMAAFFPEKSISVIDIIAGVLMIGFIAAEGIADNQQFRFHLEKKSPAKSGNKFSESVKKGFLSEGLWRYSRHPNFTSEQAIWLCFYLFSIAASGRLINFTIAGPILLILIFVGSSRLTENISSRKYPEYSVYQREVPRFIPIKRRRSVEQD